MSAKHEHVVKSNGTLSANEGRSRRMKGNENAAKSGIHSVKKVLTRFGAKAINQRKKPGVEWKRLYVGLCAELLGEQPRQLQSLDTRTLARRLAEKFSVAQCAEVELLASELWMIRALDAHIINQTSVVRQKSVLPVIQQRNELIAAYQRHRTLFHKLPSLSLPGKEPRLEDEFELNEAESLDAAGRRADIQTSREIQGNGEEPAGAETDSE